MSSFPSSEERVRDPAGDGQPSQDLAQLRELLIGPEQAQLQALQERLDDPKVRSEELSQLIAEALALRVRRDHALQHVLNPVVEEALRVSVARDPSILATSLFPIIGEAARKWVALALRSMVESLNQMLERSVSWESLKWRLEALRTGKSVGEVALMRSLRYRVEQVFLIHLETGLLLQHVVREGQGIQDANLVSGMLTAVQDFVRDSFTGRQSEQLETMQVGEFMVWLQHGPLAMLAAVVSGTPPPELRYVFQRALEDVHREFGTAISGYRGDTTDVAGTRRRLEACLLGKQLQPIQRRKSYKVAWVLSLVVVLIAAGLFYWLRERHRWNTLVWRLRSEPGIVVTSAEKRWGGYALTGLRDPLSADPGKLVRLSGIDPVKVRERWESYLSLDPKFVLSRQLMAQREQIEKQVLRFPLNSTQLEPDQVVKLDVIEAQLANLQQYAYFSGHKIRVEVFGHTDQSGREQTNTALSQRRAEEVVRALVARGINPDNLEAQGVAASQPVRRISGFYQDELNRRVTFRVILSGDEKP